MDEPVSGIYEELITNLVDRRLGELDPELIAREDIDPADASDLLARHLAALARRALSSVRGEDDAGVRQQVRLANEIAEAIRAVAPAVNTVDDFVHDSSQQLMEILDRRTPTGEVPRTTRPGVPLSASALLVNGRDQPRIGTEVQRELASADRVDLLCAFVKWHGLRIIEADLEALIRRGARLRVLTTTYVGATERRALDRLVELGATVKISYETRTTRLHAKAWLFHRRSGYSTAYVGSSNLSKSALLDGLEWNVRLSNGEHAHLLETFRATFDEYWEDPAFEAYDPSNAQARERLDTALRAEHGHSVGLPLDITTLDVRPWGYQQEILDELAAEREVHDSHRNLVVMATGTGKTVVAGLDYRRLQREGKVDSLLFVAHREEILSQSLSTFRHILRQGSFGERFVGGDRPGAWRHVFASVQSLARLDLERDLAPHHFDMVIVDEFHHASTETQTYARLLRHLDPKVLLGLTATPERADGGEILAWFAGRTAVELRLWEALERGLLAPFQYFGVHDETDLASIQWRRGTGYDVAALTNLYTAHDARVAIVLQALRDKVSDLGSMRALGFCVSIDHAEYMAQRFNEAGIASESVTSRTPMETRRAALERLRRQESNVVFTVDLFNEGVDVPEIDTVLFLRPTESATVFLQQLGRGLRLSDDKPCLTVLDFIGNQHGRFRFDLRYRALTGLTRRGLARDVEAGFPALPAGCHIALDRVAGKIVLDNVRSALRVDWKGLVAELTQLGPCSLEAFLAETGLELEDLYRHAKGGWTELRRLAGHEARPAGPQDAAIARAIGRMLHIDDLERLQFLTELLAEPAAPSVGVLGGRAGRLGAMAHFLLWTWNVALAEMDQRMALLWEHPARIEELREVVGVLRSRVRRITRPASPGGDRPLHVHARYSLAELLAAFGVPNPAASRGAGVKWVEAGAADVFWFNLRKTEKHFSPRTMYADRAISPTLFQWESQHATSASSATGARYIAHRERGSSVHLFFRETKESDGALGAPAYLYAGPATYVSHTGDRPMRIIWKLEHELPADVFHAARVATG